MLSEICWAVALIVRSGLSTRPATTHPSTAETTAIAPTIALEPDLVIVAEAADAMTALAFADSTAPSFARIDVLLPDELGGLALVRSLARRPNCAVVAMSVRGGLHHAALAAGAIAFVEKSGDIDAVLDAVRAAAAPV